MSLWQLSALDFDTVWTLSKIVIQVRKLLALCALPMALAALPAGPVAAQATASSSSDDLQDALRRIARNSNDSSALADAGLAALDMGDTRAAIGFLAKADQIYPRSGRVKAGLARALLKEENPFGAIRYFDEAIVHGIAPHEIALDRGLAYDLIGRNADAQKDYELAMQRGQSKQLLNRYAISLGISGNIEAADAKLNPLLQKSDRDAWRNRAFIFAMNGEKKEANKIARQTMQKRMASAIKPFFDRMSKLTAAQKAAAVHFGHFPASENIGVDVASVRFAANSAVRGGDGADAGLIPVGEPLGEEVEKPRVLAMPDTSPRRRPGSSSGPKKNQRPSDKSEKQVAVALPQTELPAPSSARPLVRPGSALPETEASTAKADPRARPGFETAVGGDSGQGGDRKPVQTAAVETRAPLVSETVKRQVAIGDVQSGQNPPSKPPSGSAASKPVDLITFDLAKTSATTAPATNAGAAGSAAQTKSLSAIIGAIEIPEQETRPKVVPVDLQKITPAKPKPKKVATKPETVEPKKPEHPKRYWVQIATGSNLSALKFDYRKMARRNAELFDKQEGWTSPWGKTRRLVVGPFDDLTAAKKFESGFRKNGGDGFAWVSAQGVEVNKLNP